jgi:hypothetical protein
MSTSRTFYSIGCILWPRPGGWLDSRSFLVAEDPSAGAVAAVHGAGFGGHKQDAVWIPVHQMQRRGKAVFAARVQHFVRADMEFVLHRHALAPVGVAGIVRIQQCRPVGNYSHGHASFGILNPFLFFLGEVNDQGDLFELGDAILHLPVPIFPVQAVHFFEKADLLIIARFPGGRCVTTESASGFWFSATVILAIMYLPSFVGAGENRLDYVLVFHPRGVSHYREI